MIFPETHDPYGNLITEEIHDDFSKENTDEVLPEVLPEAYAEEKKEPSEDSVSYHLERRAKLLKNQAEEKLKKESLSNLVGFGLVGIIGILILKRYLK